MSPRKPRKESEKFNQVMAEARRERELRETTYREKALKLFPWVCGRCGREFSGKRLKELTVHHKDHNHDNNPTDGSNWELLCIYCHDMEHTKYLDADHFGDSGDGGSRAEGLHRPFAELANLLKEKE